jgi:GMP synthase (glutamine-hydrolysing)
MKKMKAEIIVVDFGGQYAHLISRRFRQLGVYTSVVPYHRLFAHLNEHVKGIVLSGGPASVYEKDSPVIDLSKLKGRPILGICYGLQLITSQFGGDIRPGKKREYGKAKLRVIKKDLLFEELPNEFVVWMSHSDEVSKMPKGFTVLADTETSPYAVISGQKIYGLQFHPEVHHTEYGLKILENFAYKICGIVPDFGMKDRTKEIIEKIRKTVGKGRVLCAVSGGVDSTVMAYLVWKAVGKQATLLFVDHGLLRKGEVEEVKQLFKKLGIGNFVFIDAKDRFLRRLRGIKDPEEKRKAIGDEFVKVFEEVAALYGPFEWLAQGTLYPDVIESGKSKGPAAKIKTHHNVGGLPIRLSFKLLEPLKDLYKDEVREIAIQLGLPKKLIMRHPFPGPGLSVRIIGEVTLEKLKICREASWIVEEILRRRGLYDKVWQAFAIVGDDKFTGVKGDRRAYGYMVIVRIVASEDAMTADWVRLPYDVLDEIGRKITNELPNVVWVSYVITSKPPSTIEPQ